MYPILKSLIYLSETIRISGESLGCPPKFDHRVALVHRLPLVATFRLNFKMPFKLIRKEVYESAFSACLASENAARFDKYGRFIQIHQYYTMALKSKLKFTNSRPLECAMYINAKVIFFLGGGGGILNIIVLCNFLKILMGSDKMIHKVFKTHKTLYKQNPLDNFFSFNI